MGFSFNKLKYYPTNKLQECRTLHINSLQICLIYANNKEEYASDCTWINISLCSLLSNQ